MQVLDMLKSIGLPKARAYFQRTYTPAIPSAHILQPDSQQENCNLDEDDFEENQFFPGEESELSAAATPDGRTRLRLIGESVKKLSPYMAALVACLKPTGGKWPDNKSESSLEFRDRVICHTYVHLLRCHSSLLSTWIITPFCDEHGAQFTGDLFVWLVHNFSLHKSYNSFLFAQLSPFKIKQYLFRYRISPTKSLNIGIYGRNEGGENAQKQVKEHYFKWTDRKPGCFRSLVNQHIEVYIGGNSLFPDLCPPPVDFETENKSSWTKRFGAKKTCSSCSACSADLPDNCQSLQMKLDASPLAAFSIEFNSHQMFSKLKSSVFQYSSLKMDFMFAKFLKISIDSAAEATLQALYCDECVLMFQVLYALHFSLVRDLQW
jgi:hypothetical protein